MTMIGVGAVMVMTMIGVGVATAAGADQPKSISRVGVVGWDWQVRM